MGPWFLNLGQNAWVSPFFDSDVIQTLEIIEYRRVSIRSEVSDVINASASRVAPSAARCEGVDTVVTYQFEGSVAAAAAAIASDVM